MSSSPVCHSPAVPRPTVPAWIQVVREGPAVVLAGAVLIALQAGLRAWQLYPSWFYADDYRLLDDATGTPFGLDYLLEPFDSQFMPLGRAVAWVVADSGHVDWTLAATLTLGFSTLAGAACLWMLVTLFGARWGVLAPLALYLTSALSLPGLMWWAASLNQVPMQAVVFAAVATWVRYLRGGRWPWLLATLAVVAVGLLAYVKALLVLGLLAFLVLAYFSAGGARRRILAALRRYWPAAVAAAVLGGAFAYYYLTQVPSVFEEATGPVAGDLAQTMLGTAFPSGLAGGPWRWNTSNPPAAVADPPAVMVNLAWVAIALLVCVVALRRRRSLRAWALLAGYLGAAYVLLLVSRAPVSGGYGGLEYRYLTDVAAVAVLCLGLATMPLRGAVESSEARERPLLLLEPPAWLVAGLTTLVCVSSLGSSAYYAHVWHDDHPGADYVARAVEGLDGQGELDLADQVVPPEVVTPLSAPLNTTARLLPLVASNVHFPSSTASLVVLDEDGTPFRAEVEGDVDSPPGPVPGCGWQLRGGRTVTVPLSADVFDFGWWVQVDYLASADDVMMVGTGDSEQEVQVSRGLNSVFLHVDAGFGEVVLGGTRPDTTVCVDRIVVGEPEPAGAL